MMMMMMMMKHMTTTYHAPPFFDRETTAVFVKLAQLSVPQTSWPTFPEPAEGRGVINRRIYLTSSSLVSGNVIREPGYVAEG